MGLASRLRIRFSRARLRARYDSHLSDHGPQLVWSGPEATGALGDARQVYEELFSSAKISLRVVSYAYNDSPNIFGRLARNLDATPQAASNAGSRHRALSTQGEKAPEQDGRRPLRTGFLAALAWQTASPRVLRSAIRQAGPQREGSCQCGRGGRDAVARNVGEPHGARLGRQHRTRPAGSGSVSRGWRSQSFPTAHQAR